MPAADRIAMQHEKLEEAEQLFRQIGVCELAATRCLWHATKRWTEAGGSIDVLEDFDRVLEQQLRIAQKLAAIQAEWREVVQATELDLLDLAQALALKTEALEASRVVH